MAPADKEAAAFFGIFVGPLRGQQSDMKRAAQPYGQSLKNDPDDSALLTEAFCYASTSGDLDAAGTYASKIVSKTADDRAAATAAVAFNTRVFVRGKLPGQPR